jgi:hypothetical protein
MSSTLYTMKLIITSLQILKARITYTYKPTALGRWTRESCDIKTYRRVDLTNEDHCGVCNRDARGTPISGGLVTSNYKLENMPTISNKTYMIINDDIVFVQ